MATATCNHCYARGVCDCYACHKLTGTPNLGLTYVSCQACKGRGYHNYYKEPDKYCKHCNGSGRCSCLGCYHHMGWQVENSSWWPLICTVCGGSGWYDE
jgi:hypothetical protein